MYATDFFGCFGYGVFINKSLIVYIYHSKCFATSPLYLVNFQKNVSSTNDLCIV